MFDQDPLSAAVRQLRSLGVGPAAGSLFRRTIKDSLATLLSTIQTDVGEFSASRNPDILPELEAHCLDHLEAVAVLLEGASLDTGFIVEHAQRRAHQRFPLDAELKTYRCLSRVLADTVREAAIGVASDETELRPVVAATAALAIEYTSAAASLATREYVAATRSLAEAAGDRRSELFALLLDGFDESDSRAARLLRNAGYLEQRQTYAVVAVRDVEPREMDNSDRVERIQQSLSEILGNTPARVLTGTRDKTVFAIVSATRRQSGWTRPHTVVSELVAGPLRLMGNAVLVGISNDAPSTAHIPKALREALIALQQADRSKRVRRFGDIGFLELLLTQASTEASAELPEWKETLVAADKKNKLRQTLFAYADNDMNVIRTAKSLGMHPNSIYARFDRILSLTGLDPQRYHALTELICGLRLLTG
ncbi:MAG: helix-turn-helix domain-containing protein [Woeseiaceae bacterium]|nr:helix-turn-helix domain-containing protein [Woeseiaceae bacterium]